MPNKTYSSGTVIDSASLNDFNDVTYDILGDGTNAPATKAAARTNLGLGSVATQPANNVAITGGSILGTNLAPLASPALTGNPTAPTATVLDSDTTIATTAFVHSVTEGPGFSAIRPSGTQAITSTPSIITFATVNWNTGQFVGNQFTCNRKGVYNIIGKLFIAVTGASVVSFSVYKNGVETARLFQTTFAGAGNILSGGSTDMLLLVGDVIDIRATATGGGVVGIVDPVAPLLCEFSTVFIRDVA